MTQATQEKHTAPTLSFGLPVRNGERFIRRALESLEAQDFEDFEVVICDNQSTDRTPEIIREFADRDARFRYVLNKTNIGQLANFNRVFELSTGRYFRWVGFDDWLEPSCARRSVEALDANPDAIGVFTFWLNADDSGKEQLITFKRNPVSSKWVLGRMVSMLWHQQLPIGIDPVYSTLRRRLVEKTGLFPISPWNDRVISVEMALTGPFCHIKECLSTRRHSPIPANERLTEFHPSITPQNATADRIAPRWTMYRDFAKVVLHSSLNPVQQVVVTALVVSYGGLHHLRGLARRATDLVKA